MSFDTVLPERWTIRDMSAILVFGLFHMLDREQLSEMLDLITGWLAPAGLVFITAWQVKDPRSQDIRESWHEIARNSFRNGSGDILTYLDSDEILSLFDGWQVIHQWEGLGPEHRHGAASPERHGCVDFVARIPERL